MIAFSLCRWHPGLKLFCLTLATAALGGAVCPSPVSAQEKDYEEWLKRQRQEYKQFLNEQDKAFLKFLKEKWTNVRIDTTAASPIDDKPRRIPRADERPTETPPAPNEPSPEDKTGQPDPPTPDPRPRADQDSAALPDPGGATPPPQPDAPNPPPENEDPADAPEATPDEPAPAGGEPERPSSANPVPDPPAPKNPASEEEPERAPLNREASLSFFGTSTTVPYGTASTPRLKSAPGKSSIRRFWKTMAKGPYRPTLDVLQKQREEMGLSDWGYYRYLRDLSTQLYGDDASNEQVLWTWFMLMKSGYAARVGYRENEVFLMLPVDQKIFGRPQMHIDGQRYYLMVEDMSGSLRTYEGQHGEASQALQLDEGTLPDVAEGRTTRTVEFSFQDQRHSLEVAYNPSAVDYLQSYPNVELKVLMGAGVSSTARTAFRETLQPLVADRGPRASLNLLLTFVQFATDYKRDQDHFGEERYLFPEESLASDYSDCEDRAVLMAYLVRTFLDRDVVGLKWPNHVALAVRAGNELQVASKDHTVTVDGATYIYADPTYIGSSLGMEMPLVEGQTPEIIMLGE